MIVSSSKWDCASYSPSLSLSLSIVGRLICLNKWLMSLFESTLSLFTILMILGFTHMAECEYTFYTGPCNNRYLRSPSYYNEEELSS